MATDLTEMQISKDESLLTFWAPMLAAMIPVDPSSSETISMKTRVKREIRVCVGDSPERLAQADNLVVQRYARQNYSHEDLIRKTSNAVTLIGYSGEGSVAGTITISLDSPGEGLLADGNYLNEVNKVRDRGNRVCEFNALAIDAGIRSKIFIARLFHIAMLYPWGIFGHKDLVIEVTPIHSRFYQRMLGFRKIGAERVCPRVNTMGVLLHLSLDWAYERIESVGGQGDKSANDKTLYPYFFGKSETALILDRIRDFMIHPAFSGPTLGRTG
ncbi:MAG: N-acyl amino acid synthase FeeM domain-containing protein [Leptospirales bacterium]